MKLKTNIEYINNILGEIPEFLYHGRRGEHIPNNEYEIVVYNNEEEIKGKRFWEYKGRTHLDFAFHGFYLTPCEALARKWAFSDIPKDNENYQVLKFKINYDALEDLNHLKDYKKFVPDNLIQILRERGE